MEEINKSLFPVTFYFLPQQSSWWALVLWPKTSKTLFGQVNYSCFYLELYKNNFKNLIRTSKFKFSFRGLPQMLSHQWISFPFFGGVHVAHLFSFLCRVFCSEWIWIATGKLYHLRLRVECTLFCNLQSWARTHAILVIGLYELLDPTT